jgi:hypothetical protein
MRFSVWDELCDTPAGRTLTSAPVRRDERVDVDTYRTMDDGNNKQCKFIANANANVIDTTEGGKNRETPRVTVFLKDF